jgi:hypothetical protein
MISNSSTKILSINKLSQKKLNSENELEKFAKRIGEKAMQNFN